jgi:hypothetical protein
MNHLLGVLQRSQARQTPLWRQDRRTSLATFPLRCHVQPSPCPTCCSTKYLFKNLYRRWGWKGLQARTGVENGNSEPSIKRKLALSRPS